MAITGNVQELLGIETRSTDLSVSNLKANIVADNLLRANKFRIVTAGPGVYNNTYSPVSEVTASFGDYRGPKDISKHPQMREILINCHSANLPGRTVTTVDHTHHGPVRKMPTGEAYDDFTTTFYLSESMKERIFFDDWLDRIGGYDYFTEYYDKFVSIMTLVEINNFGDEVNAWNFFEIYPIGISEVQFAYGNGDSVAEFTVTWAYHHFEHKAIMNGSSKAGKSLWDYYKKAADSLADSIPAVSGVTGMIAGQILSRR